MKFANDLGREKGGAPYDFFPSAQVDWFQGKDQLDLRRFGSTLLTRPELSLPRVRALDVT